MKIAITGGGTGGHIFPALAVAQALLHGSHSLLYIGKNNSMESELVPAQGIDFQGIDFFGMPRKPSLQLIKWVFALKQAKQQARVLLEGFQPDLVFGTGGYVSAPVLLAAQSLKIPYILHEPDAMPGLANRFVAQKAAMITAAFSDSATYFKIDKHAQKFHHTGNPVRQDIGQHTKAEALQKLELNWDPSTPVLLVFGGSQGARRINQAIIGALPALLRDNKVNVIHLSGQKLYEESIQALPETLASHPGYLLRPFSQQMPLLLDASDIALCRSGSLSLSELYVAGLPTILIPYPFAAANHQFKNAEASVKAGASMMLPDKDLTADTLMALLLLILEQPEIQQRMADAAKALAKPHATADIVRLIERCGGYPVSG